MFKVITDNRQPTTDNPLCLCGEKSVEPNNEYKLLTNPKSPSGGLRGTKILILTSEFPPQPGGIGNHAFHLAKGLQGSGYEVTLLCDRRSDSGVEEEAFDAQASFKIIRIPRRKFILISYLDRVKTAFALGKEAEMVLASGKFSLWLGAFMNLFIKKRFIAIIHGSEIQLPNPLLRKLTDFSLKRYEAVIAVSNFTKSLVAHLSLKNIDVIPNGFEMEVPDVCSVKQDPMPVLITIGNVTERKGQQNVVNALPVLLKKYPDLQYHIVGIPTDKAKLEKLALYLGVEKSVEFYGKVDEKTKQELLLQSDVFVMLSEKTKSGDVEGFGIAILEANALGVPAIGARGCGIEDAIEDGVSGRLIDNRDSEGFERALTEILGGYPEYSKGARAWSDGFGWDKVINLYLGMLREPQRHREHRGKK